MAYYRKVKVFIDCNLDLNEILIWAEVMFLTNSSNRAVI